MAGLLNRYILQLLETCCFFHQNDGKPPFARQCSGVLDAFICLGLSKWQLFLTTGQSQTRLKSRHFGNLGSERAKKAAKRTGWGSQGDHLPEHPAGETSGCAAGGELGTERHGFPSAFFRGNVGWFQRPQVSNSFGKSFKAQL